MKVWKCWNEKVLELVFNRLPGTPIESVVRKYASKLKYINY